MTDYGYCQSEACWGDPFMDGATVTKVMQGIRDVGGTRVRLGVQVGSWADLDRAINAATGLKVLLCILGNETLQPGSQSNPFAFAALCEAIALRYPQVSEFEILNEMNSVFNPPILKPKDDDPPWPAPRVATYVDFLKAAYAAIKSVRPSSTVIAGGTVPAPSWSGLTVDPLQWYAQLYAAGAKDYMDALGFHLYCDSAPSPNIRQWRYLTDIRALMVTNGDAMKQVWVTEVGTGNPGPGINDATTECDWLKIMVDGILSYPWCGPFFIYNFKNSYANLSDATGGNYGIVHYDFTPKSPKYDYAFAINRRTGVFMALTDAEQQELLTKVRAIFDDSHNTLDQLGPSKPGWPSLGLNAKGQELTWRDAFGVLKDEVTAIARKLGV